MKAMRGLDRDGDVAGGDECAGETWESGTNTGEAAIKWWTLPRRARNVLRPDVARPKAGRASPRRVTKCASRREMYGTPTLWHAVAMHARMVSPFSFVLSMTTCATLADLSRTGV
eukprot:ctg_177.g72